MQKLFSLEKSPTHALTVFLERLQKEGLTDRQYFLMQRNSIDHTKDLLQFVVYVIHPIFGVNIMDKLLTKDEEGIQHIVLFTNQVMIEARSQAQSELMIEYWSDPKNCENFTTKRNDPNGSWKDFSQAMVGHNANPDHVFNSEKYREAKSKALTGRSWTLTGPRHQLPPGVVVMQPCRYCGQFYHFRAVRQHQDQCNV